jgi:hypothetical protein
MTTFCSALLIAILVGTPPGSHPASQPQSRPARTEIPAEVFPFPEKLGLVVAWTAITSTHNNQVIVGLCRTSEPAWLAQFDDPSRSFVETLSVGAAIHDEGEGKAPQAKIHTQLVELSDGWVYGGTHLAENGDANSYPGGHWFRYDPRSHEMEDLGLAMAHEGLITLQADEPRGCLYAITYPGAYLLRFDLVSRQTQVLGKTSRDDHVPRAFFVLGPGNVYTNQVYSPASQPGGIYVFDAATEAGRVEPLPVYRKVQGRYTERVEQDAAKVYNYWLAGAAGPGSSVAYTTGYYSGHFVSLHLAANGELVIRDHGLTVPDAPAKPDNGPFSQGMCMVGESVLFTVAIGEEKLGTAEVRLLRYDPARDVIRELGVICTRQGQSITNCTAMTCSRSGQLYLVGNVPGQASVVLLRIGLSEIGLSTKGAQP